MRNKSEQRRYIRVDVEGEDFRNLMLKQGGLFKVTNDKEMSSKKASAIFIALSVIPSQGYGYCLNQHRYLCQQQRQHLQQRW